MFHWKTLTILLSILFVTTACVFPQGDEYEKVYYDFMISTYFRLAVTKTDGSQFKEALMLPKNSEFDAMKIIYFTNQDQNIVIAKADRAYLLDANNLLLIKSNDLNFARIYEPSLSPDEQHIVFGARNKNSNWDLYLMDANDLSVTNITNSPSTLERFPSFTQDGQNIAFTSIEFGKQQSIIILNLSTSTFDTLLTSPSSDSTPNDYDLQFVSPFLNISDSLLYYCNFYNHSLVSYSLKSKSSNPFYQYVYPWRPMYFTKDGQFVLFIGYSYPHKLICMDLSNKSVSTITKLEKTDIDYTLSADGSKIAFTTLTQKNELNGVPSGDYDYYQLWIINKDGSNKKFIDSGRWPVFSADDSRLAYDKAYYSVRGE